MPSLAGSVRSRVWRHADFCAVVNNGRAGQRKLAQGGQFELAFVAFGKPKEAVLVMIVQESWDGRNPAGKIGLMLLQKGIKRSHIHRAQAKRSRIAWASKKSSVPSKRPWYFN